MLRWTPLVVVFALVGLVGCAGCDSKPAPKPNAGTGTEDHGHSHDAKGPHMGQVMVIGEEEYHAEVLWDNASGKVTIYLLDKDMKVNAAAASAQETIAIEGKMKDETKNYELAAVGRTTGDMPMASQFEVDDKDLASLLENLGGNNSAILKVKIGDKPYDAKISFDDHGHGH